MTTEANPPPSTSRSPKMAIIVVAIIVVLAGGAFVAYKLTKSDGTTREPAYKVAKDVGAALAAGDTATIAKLSTAAGKTALLAITPADAKEFTFAGCEPLEGSDPTKQCVFDRPGGQLALVLISPDKKWVVNSATIGPTGTDPATTPST